MLANQEMRIAKIHTKRTNAKDLAHQQSFQLVHQMATVAGDSFVHQMATVAGDSFVPCSWPQVMSLASKEVGV